MAQSEARVWWADVQHLRDAVERTDEARRRADQADLAARRAMRERRHAEAAVALTHRAAEDGTVPPPRADTGPRRRTEDLAAHGGDHVDSAAGAPPLREHGRAGAAPARRVVEIRGRTVPAPAVPRSIEIDRRRPPRRPIERVGPRPDRMAMWALLMGLLLILVAVGTADASTFAR